jgi:peptidoglycan/xylan/chitin deacetylase (PgdA/CDA1 family)
VSSKNTEPPRDLIGYGRRPPGIKWPGARRLAVNFVINYEEGAETNYPDDGANEIVGSIDYAGKPQSRDLALESNYEFGSRVGIWRLLSVFDRFSVQTTIFACGLAIERNPAVGEAIAEKGHEACGHGWRWDEPWTLTEEEERESIAKTVTTLERIVGERPVGWYSRYGPSVNTRRLLVEEGGFLYDSNAYNDELPYFVSESRLRHLVVPYSNLYNDGRYMIQPIWPSPSIWLENITTAVEFLLNEEWTTARMITVGLHPRWAGHPARASALAELLAYLLGREEQVWIPRRRDIAQWWIDATVQDRFNQEGRI